MPLPLRLAAEPYARKAFGRGCFVLPSVDEDRVCLIVAEEGIVGLALNKDYKDEDVADIISIPLSMLPRNFLVRTDADTEEFQWRLPGMEPCTDVSRKSILENTPPVNHLCAETIVQSIERYYQRQVLEPSIRGFLAILEKQFPRNDLYLFELLQNAVDDGADKIVIKSKKTNKIESCGLMFCHNGKCFSPLDVLGLASVGLSTKSDSNNKKIGFMGVGFKAVYKRFARVHVYDDTWRFSFDEPESTPAMEPSHSWVLKPRWISQSDENAVDMMRRQTMGDSKEWCHFLLLRPRGGIQVVLNDIARLPSTVPVLLGYQALVGKKASSKSESKEWILDWEDKVYHVSTPPTTIETEKNSSASMSYPIYSRNVSRMGNGSRSSSSMSNVWVSSCSDSLLLDKRMRDQRGNVGQGTSQCWQFVTVGFIPDPKAQKAYEMHTKKKWKQEKETSEQYEEVSIFFEVDTKTRLPQYSSSRGSVHAMLPTKLRLSCPLHLQASWLLSVDRQDVQSLVENDWNMSLLSQFPRLCFVFLQYIASLLDKTPKEACSRNPSLSAAYKLLPVFEAEPVDNKSRGYSQKAYFSRILDQKLPMTEVLEGTKRCPVVPAWHIREQLTFLPASKVIYLPAPFLHLLPVSFLSCWWDSLSPFASDEMGECSYHSMWSEVARPTESTLKANIRRLECAIAGEVSTGSVDQKICLSVRLLAALGRCLSCSIPPKRSTEKSVSTSDENESIEMFGDVLPSISAWPIFLTERETNAPVKLVTPERIVFLSSDFTAAALPIAVYQLLRPAAKLVSTAEVSSTGDRTRAFSKGAKKGSASSNANARSSLFLMDDKVERVLTSSPGDTSSLGLNASVIDSANAFMDHIKTALFPNRVISAESACRALLSHWSDEYRAGMPAEYVDKVVELFDWAFGSNRFDAMSHFLVESDDTHRSREMPRLVPASEAYIDASITPETAGLRDRNNKENSSGSNSNSTLRYVSNVYLTQSKLLGRITSQSLKRFQLFLERCGAQKGISLEAFKRKITDDELGQHLNGSLPKLRTSNPSVDLHLPFNLGQITKKRAEIIDVDFSEEWLKIIKNLRHEVSSAHHTVSLVSILLENADCAQTPNANTTPYLKALLAGKRPVEMPAQVDSSSRLAQDLDNVPPPAFARYVYLPPGQPGAQTVNLSPAKWLQRLAQERWIPARMPGSQPDDPPSSVLRPCEVVFPQRSGSSKKKRQSDDTSGAVLDPQSHPNMPIAAISSTSVEALCSLPKNIQEVLQWGTVQPPPPIDMLEAKANEFRIKMNSKDYLCQRMQDNTYGSWVYCPRADYDLIVNIWKGICNAEREKRLSPRDKRRVTAACASRDDATAVFVIPGAKCQLYCLDRCRFHDASVAKDVDTKLSVSSLSSLGFFLNFNHWDDVFRASWPLAEFASELKSILSVSGLQSSDQVAFLNAYFDELSNSDSKRGAPLDNEIIAISSCLWGCFKSLGYSMSDIESCASNDSLVEKCHMKLRDKIPAFFVYCKAGPGIGPGAFPSRWVLLWGKQKVGDEKLLTSETIMPVFMDDLKQPPQGCGLHRSSLLRPEHKLQPIGMFDLDSCRRGCEHLSSFDQQSMRLINQQIIKLLKLPAVSDKRYFSLSSRAKGTKLLVDASKRLTVISLLLHELHPLHEQHLKKKLRFLPPIYKYDSLLLSFKYPVFIKGRFQSTSAMTIPAFAIRGGRESVAESPLWSSADAELATESVQSILLAGSGVDYVAELEDIVLTHLYGNQPVLGARARKALSLLAHIEDEALFFKYLSRHFPEFLPKSSDNDEGSSAISLIMDEDSSKSLLLRAVSLLHEEVQQTKSGSSKRLRSDDADEEYTNIAASSLRKLPTNRESDLEDVNSKRPRMEVSPSGRGRGISNKPAWMTNPEVITNLDSSEGLKTLKDEEGKSPAGLSKRPSPLKTPSSSVNSNLDMLAHLPSGPDSSRGRGRGVDNTPAWMTNNNHNPLSSSQNVLECNEVSARVVDGAGGTSNMASARDISSSNFKRSYEELQDQATITKKDNHNGDESILKQAKVSSPSEENAVNASSSEQLASEFLWKLADGQCLKESFKDADAAGVNSIPSVSEESRVHVGQGRGRGRGVVNLPAWMTREGEAASSTTNGDIISPVEQQQPQQQQQQQSQQVVVPTEECLSFTVMHNILSLLVNRPRATKSGQASPHNSRNDKTISDFTAAVAKILTDSADNCRKMVALCRPTSLQHLLDYYDQNLDLNSLDPSRARHIKGKLDSVADYVALIVEREHQTS